MVLAVPDEQANRLVRKGGLRLQGRRYDIEAYEEVRPDDFCAAAVGVATPEHSAHEPPRDASGARRSTRRQPTGAPSGDARQGRATDAQETPRTDPQETLRGKMEVEEEHESAPEEAMEE